MKKKRLLSWPSYLLSQKEGPFPSLHCVEILSFQKENIMPH